MGTNEQRVIDAARVFVAADAAYRATIADWKSCERRADTRCYHGEQFGAHNAPADQMCAACLSNKQQSMQRRQDCKRRYVALRKLRKAVAQCSQG